jgi:endonuclease/exonuclease/phosphatase family metal-dependent hydrolase
MKLASYNVENLFFRARALNLPNWSDGAEILKQHAAVNDLLNRQKYSKADNLKIVTLLRELGVDKSDDGGKFAILRENRGHLLQRAKGRVDVVANGRGDWVGWVDLKIEEVDSVATQNTARVVKALEPDVLAVVEVESRPSLVRFSEHVMPSVQAQPYEHTMLIDGNDERGIDVGILLRQGFDLLRMCSHVDDADEHGRIFSRDCPEFLVATPGGQEVLVIVNHLKSKGFGTQARSNATRLRQAQRAKEIYEHAVASGSENVAVVGDFNDSPDSQALMPLLKETDLTDVSVHPSFENGGRSGTFGNGTSKDKIDYILLSPALFKRVLGGGIFRDGVWGGTDGKLFPHFPEITKPSEAASDHAAIWCELDF